MMKHNTYNRKFSGCFILFLIWFKALSNYVNSDSVWFSCWSKWQINEKIISKWWCNWSHITSCYPTLQANREAVHQDSCIKLISCFWSQQKVKATSSLLNASCWNKVRSVSSTKCDFNQVIYAGHYKGKLLFQDKLRWGQQTRIKLWSRRQNHISVSSTAPASLI